MYTAAQRSANNLVPRLQLLFGFEAEFYLHLLPRLANQAAGGGGVRVGLWCVVVRLESAWAKTSEQVSDYTDDGLGRKPIRRAYIRQ